MCSASYQKPYPPARRTVSRRGEGDEERGDACAGRVDFNPPPPRGGRQYTADTVPTYQPFQSTPSEGRETVSRIWCLHRIQVSIHSLRGEGDCMEQEGGGMSKISIHSLRGEGDPCAGLTAQSYSIISIHSLRGEGDVPACKLHDALLISIHSLRGEGDPI